jgi:hypothetical protein
MAFISRSVSIRSVLPYPLLTKTRDAWEIRRRCYFSVQGNVRQVPRLVILVQLVGVWWNADTSASQFGQHQIEDSTGCTSLSEVFETSLWFIIDDTDWHRSRYDANLLDPLSHLHSNTQGLEIRSWDAQIVLFEYSTVSQRFQLFLLFAQLAAVRSMPRFNHSDEKGKEPKQNSVTHRSDDQQETSKYEELASIHVLRVKWARISPLVVPGNPSASSASSTARAAGEVCASWKREFFILSARRCFVLVVRQISFPRVDWRRIFFRRRLYLLGNGNKWNTFSNRVLLSIRRWYGRSQFRARCHVLVFPRMPILFWLNSLSYHAINVESLALSNYSINHQPVETSNA